MLIETIAGLAALGVSARWNWWRPAAAGLPILMYHKVGDPPAGSKLKKLWVSTGQFRRQMTYLRDRGYHTMTLAEIAGLIDAGAPVPPNAVVITFDDGYKNNVDNALPILQDFGFRAVIFIVTGAVGRDNFWHDPANETRIPMVSWEEVRALDKAGWEIGSHTANHRRMSKLSDGEAREELLQSKNALSEKLGKIPVSFANPYGDGSDDPRLRALIREAGYRWACSVHQGKADLAGDPLRLKRLFIRGDDLSWDFHLQMTRGKARF